MYVSDTYPKRFDRTEDAIVLSESEPRFRIDVSMASHHGDRWRPAGTLRCPPQPVLAADPLQITDIRQCTILRLCKEALG